MQKVKKVVVETAIAGISVADFPTTTLNSSYLYSSVQSVANTKKAYHE